MYLQNLSLLHLRNLQSVQLSFTSHFNVFVGQNGSGKTSLLEAIYLLATGQSFRATVAKEFITYGQTSSVVSGLLHGVPESLQQAIRVGVERSLFGGTKIRIAEQDCLKRSTLAKLFPIQRIDHTSYSLLTAEPSHRRSFLDWILFHVEHDFYDTWKKFRRALQQRNAALKVGGELSVWDDLFIETGTKIDIYRKSVLERFMPVFVPVLESLLPLGQPVTAGYEQGWRSECSLEESLDKNRARDSMYGYTTVGPQKADVEWLVGGIPARACLSRGQVKLFVCGLLLARAAILTELTEQKGVFLIDDLQAELDRGGAERLLGALSELGLQTFVTNIHREGLEPFVSRYGMACFKVESGLICPLEVVVDS